MIILLLCLLAPPPPPALPPEPSAQAWWPAGYSFYDSHDGTAYSLRVWVDVDCLVFGDTVARVGDTWITKQEWVGDLVAHYRPGAVVTLLIRRSWYCWFRHDVILIEK